MMPVKKDTIVAIRDKTGAINSWVMFAFVNGISNASTKFLPNQAIYKRESAGNLYSSTAYYIALYVYGIPIELLYMLIYLSSFFWVTNIGNGSGNLFLLHLLNMYITFLAGYSLGYVLACCIKIEEQ